MSLQKKVSVLMSVYNSESQVIDSVKSIFRQTYKNYDLHIIDDSSTDNTYDVIKEYISDYPNVNLIKNKENLGLTKSLNILISESGGELIARQDADDISSPFRLEKQINKLEHHNLDACTTRALTLNENKIIPNFSYYLPKRLVIKYKNPFIHGSLIIKRTVLVNLGGYNENFYYSQDYKLFYDFINSNFKINILKEPLYFLNTKNNISSNFQQLQEYYANCVKKNKIPKVDIRDQIIP